MAAASNNGGSFASANEISSQAAQAAFSGTSHTPDVRGEQIRQEYAATLNAFHARAVAKAATAEAKAAISDALADAKRRYHTAFVGWLSSRAGTTSWMITGRSGRNEAREQKKMARADKRGRELTEILPTAMAKIDRILKEHRVAAVGGPVPAEQNKLARAERLQDVMRAANAIIRKKLTDEEKVAQIAALGLSETNARKLLLPDFAGRVGFPPYQLSNNLANIKRMQQRVSELQHRETRAEKTATEHKFTGSPEFPYAGTIEYDYADNRIRIRFDEQIPKEKFRELTRTTGFVWSRSNTAFQHAMGSRGADTTVRITGAVGLPSLRNGNGSKTGARVDTPTSKPPAPTPNGNGARGANGTKAAAGNGAARAAAAAEQRDRAFVAERVAEQLRLLRDNVADWADDRIARQIKNFRSFLERPLASNGDRALFGTKVASDLKRQQIEILIGERRRRAAQQRTERVAARAAKAAKPAPVAAPSRTAVRATDQKLAAAAHDIARQYTEAGLAQMGAGARKVSNLRSIAIRLDGGLGGLGDRKEARRAMAELTELIAAASSPAAATRNGAEAKTGAKGAVRAAAPGSVADLRSGRQALLDSLQKPLQSLVERQGWTLSGSADGDVRFTRGRDVYSVMTRGDGWFVESAFAGEDVPWYRGGRGSRAHLLTSEALGTRKHDTRRRALRTLFNALTQRGAARPSVAAARPPAPVSRPLTAAKAAPKARVRPGARVSPRGPASTRRWAGEAYTLVSSHPSKAAAMTAAERSRAAGYPSRVAKSSGAFVVYALTMAEAEAGARKRCTDLAQKRRERRAAAPTRRGGSAAVRGR